jgi:hypothetical protein
MRRFPDWEQRLAAYLEPLREKPFAWGLHDGCTFAAGAVLAMTGEDRMRGMRGYRSEAGAAKVLKERGKGTIARTMDAILERVPVAQAHRGDIVQIRGHCLAVSLGAFAVCVGEEDGRQGLVRRARADWVRAWRVPMP